MANGTLKVSNIETSSGSGTITVGASGETVDLSNGTITLNNSMKMTPAFQAYSSDGQTPSDASWTKVELDAVLFDTDSAFNNTASNYKFTVPSGEAGNYQINFGIRNSNFTTARIDVKLYKNGSEAVNTENASGGNYDTAYGGAILNLSVGDYLQMYVYQGSGSSQNIFSARNSCFMSGYKLIGV